MVFRNHVFGEPNTNNLLHAAIEWVMLDFRLEFTIYHVAFASLTSNSEAEELAGEVINCQKTL